jgi:hypothetical protein
MLLHFYVYAKVIGLAYSYLHVQAPEFKAYKGG